MPDFTGDRLIFSGVDSAPWQSLPVLISRLEKDSHATYYIVVIDTAGGGPTATRDYTDRLYEHWVQQSANQGLQLDTQRSVIVVLAIGNRQLSVKAGQSLLQNYGLNAATIEQEIVQPNFIPLAKAGNYPQGIEALLNQISGRIKAHDQQQSPASATSHEIPILPTAPQTPFPSDESFRTDQPSVPEAGFAGQQITSGRSSIAPAAIVAGSAICIGLLALLVLRWLHLRVRKPLEQKKKNFRDHVVQLSDDIDALRERHRTLPFTDKDYKEPMIGETLALYDGIQSSLETLRQRWLELMDVWDKIDTLEKNESYFGRSALLEAASLLEKVPVSDVENTLNDQCVKALDRLQDAHEQVERLDKSLDENLLRIQQQFSELQKVNLASEPYQSSLDRISDLRDRAAKIVVPDPIGCQSIQNAASEILHAAGALTERVLQHRRGIDELSEKLNKTSEWLGTLRRDGMKFCEENSDPSPLFPTIQHHCDECLKLLNLGDAETAAEHLKQGFELAAQAQSAIQLQVDSKDFCHREIPIRTSDQRQLESMLKTLDSVFVALESEFAPSSWSTVANLKSISSESVLRANSILLDATLAGTDDVQHYQRSVVLLRQLKLMQSDTSLQIATGDQRLQQLRQLRTQAIADLNRLQEYRNRVATLLQSSNRDRAAANRRFRDAESNLQDLTRVSAGSRADWPQLSQSLSSLQHEFSTAEQLANEDIRLAEQATQDMLTAQRELRQAETFYRSGFRADVSAVRPQLQNAQQALNNQEYERAIELANSAIAFARQQVRQAQSAADAADRQRELERQERLRSMDSQIGTGISGSLFSAAASHSFHSHSLSSPISITDASSHSDSSSSSLSSWSSETSQSSW